MTPERNDLLVIDFHQVNQKSQNLGKLVLKELVFDKIDILKVIL